MKNAMTKRMPKIIPGRKKKKDRYGLLGWGTGGIKLTQVVSQAGADDLHLKNDFLIDGRV